MATTYEGKRRRADGEPPSPILDLAIVTRQAKQGGQRRASDVEGGAR